LRNKLAINSRRTSQPVMQVSSVPLQCQSGEDQVHFWGSRDNRAEKILFYTMDIQQSLKTILKPWSEARLLLFLFFKEEQPGASNNAIQRRRQLQMWGVFWSRATSCKRSRADLPHVLKSGAELEPVW